MQTQTKQSSAICIEFQAQLPVVFLAPAFQGSGVMTFPSFFWPTTRIRNLLATETMTDNVILKIEMGTVSHKHGVRFRSAI